MTLKMFCDVCGKEIKKEKEDYGEVKIYEYWEGNFARDMEFHLCRDCYEKLKKFLKV